MDATCFLFVDSSAKANADDLRRLPAELQLRVLSHLPPNDVALGCRLMCKSISQLLNTPQYNAVRLSQPLPPWFAACPWQPQWQPGLRKLTFAGKLRLLSTAASSGSEVNLEHAWGLVRPCLFPELLSGSSLQRTPFYAQTWWHDPGTQAAMSGHAHLLPWLVEHGCPVNPQRTLKAAAWYCDLAGLQAAWRTIVPRLSLPGEEDSGALGPTRAETIRMAGNSGSPDARAKIAWLLDDEATGVRCVPEVPRAQLLVAAAAGAAGAGDKALVQWVRDEQGLDLTAAGPGHDLAGHPLPVLTGSMEAPSLSLAEWLVDEAGCPLPGPGDPEEGLEDLWRVAGYSGDVGKLRWLVERGVAVHPEGAMEAARRGHLEAVRYLHEECGQELSAELFAAAAGSGSIPLVSWLLDRGCPTSPQAYVEASRHGKLRMMVWLSDHADRCPRGDFRRDSLPKPFETAVKAAELEAVASMPGVTEGCKGGQESVGNALLRWAALAGHVELVRELVEQRGMEPRWDTLAAAARGGCEEVIELLLQMDSVRPGPTWISYLCAGRNADYATMCYLRRMGLRWDAEALQLAVVWRLTPPVMRWMVQQGAPWDGAAVSSALAEEEGESEGEGEYGECLEWLRVRNRRRAALRRVVVWGLSAALTVVQWRCYFWLWKRFRRARRARQ